MWADTWSLGALRGRDTITEARPRVWRPAHRQPGETSFERELRFAADRIRLQRLDDRLLDDVGLDREAVARGLPFHDPGTAACLLAALRTSPP